MEAKSNLKSLEFHKVVREQIDILDELLFTSNIPRIFENPDVSFLEVGQVEYYLAFNLSRLNQNSVTLTFHFSSGGMRIDLDGYNEACEFSERSVFEQRATVVDVLECLLFRPILIEYKGRSRFVNLFNADGSRYAIWGLQSFSAIVLSGFWKPQNVEQHLFEPVYSRNNE